MTITEMQIVTYWFFTRTPKECRDFIESMGMLEHHAKVTGDTENYELIRDARDLAHTKGNLMLESQRGELLGEQNES